MEIQRYESDLLQSNMYLIIENNHAIVIDPYRDTSPGHNLFIDKIIVTHEHYDHISGVNIWKKATGAPLLCSNSCAENIRNPRKNLASLFIVFCELQTWINLSEIPNADPKYTCNAEEIFLDRYSFVWQGHYFDLMELPGHSQGSIGILVDGLFFFSGDSLMEGRNIELRFPGGSRRQWETIGKLRIDDLPERITIYPGHFSEFKYIRKGDT